MQSEQDLKRQVIKSLKFDFPGCFIWKTHDMFTKGIPDLLFIYKGVHIFFELKVEPDGPNKFKLQKHVIAKINEAGGHAYMIWDVITARTICRDILNSKRKEGMQND